MKRLTGIAIVAGMLSVAHVQAALTVSWQYTGDLFDFDASVAAGWFVQMYQDADQNSILSDVRFFATSGNPTGLGNSGDDNLLGSFTDAVIYDDKAGYYWIEPNMGADSIAGEDVYSVLYNNSSIASATQAVIIDGTPRSLPGDGPYSYSQSTVNGSWNALVVPEPGTLALFGLGLLSMVFWKRFSR